jgi:hypothetical protein
MTADRHEGAAHLATYADVFAEADGTIVLRYHPECRLDVQKTALVASAHIALAEGRKRPVFADCRGLVSTDRASRQLAAGPDIVAVTARLAILVDNPVARVLGNFFLRVTEPAYATQIFNDESKARAWLAESAP